MNEWSPGANYSCPATSNQSGRSFRSQKEEPDKIDKGIEPIVVNIRAVSDNKVKSTQQHSLQDFTKSSMSIGCKSKKNVKVGSDPRFKRVISNGLQNDACVGTDGRSIKNLSTHQEKEDILLPKCPTWFSAGGDAKQVFHDRMEPKENSKSVKELDKNEFLLQEKPDNFEPNKHHFMDFEKIVDQNKLENVMSKDSFSNCTINTINTSLASDDILEDLPNELSMYSSASRVKKVQNWIQTQNSKPGKKQSLITVIGQTQSQDPLSSTLWEIDQRRKLAKELDKYAICKNVVEIDSGKENMVVPVKITSLPPTGRQIMEKCGTYGGANVLNENSTTPRPFIGDCCDNVKVQQDKNEKLGYVNNTETRDLTNMASRKRSSSRKKLKKSHLACDFPIKGKLLSSIIRVHCEWIFFMVFLISGILCWITFSILHSGSYMSFDIFTKKPKAMTWYEKICMWLWEFFRPSSVSLLYILSYKRNTPWDSY